jgi:hypothetical protein
MDCSKQTAPTAADTEQSAADRRAGTDVIAYMCQLDMQVNKQLRCYQGVIVLIVIMIMSLRQTDMHMSLQLGL